MPTISLDDSPFAGRTSRPPTNREAGPRGCRHCGSQLAGRYKGVQDIGGRPVPVCACGCGHDCRIPVELAA